MKMALTGVGKSQAAFRILFLIMICFSSVAHGADLTSCFMDLDGDKDVGGKDTAAFIEQYTINDCTNGCTADYDGSAVMDEPDLAEFADEFGQTDCLGVSSQADMVGPLSNAQITAYRVTSLSVPVEGPVNAVVSDDLDTAGTFSLSLNGVDDDDWVIVLAAGGEDIDHDGDGLIDDESTTSLGALYAMAKASDWRDKSLHITPLTELAYRYIEHLFSEVPPKDLAIRMADLARNLIKTDIDGNGAVDWYDILAFDPADPTHLDKLKTDYGWLSTVNGEGYSIIETLISGNTARMLSCMDDTYSYLMTRFPVPDSRYQSVKITLSVFGSGSATCDAPANLAVDSTLTEPVFEDHVYLPADESSLVTFTASPGPDSQILSWSGCDTVSSDLGQCTVALNKSRSNEYGVGPSIMI